MYATYWKRVIDLSVALTALMVLLPLLLLLTVVGAVAMRGNPFFAQRRPGRIDPKTGEERLFCLLKFRTMNGAKDRNGTLLPDAQRLTRYGRFLRSTSLDELPELWNIVIGDMSFVGPRPLLVKYLPLYTKEQRRRHEVRPGLTGLAQANGRNALTWEARFALDVAYVNNVSFAGDCCIVLDTIKAVLKREGISSQTSATMEEFTGTVHTDEKEVLHV